METIPLQYLTILSSHSQFFKDIVENPIHIVLQIIQMNLVLLCVWADWAVLGSINTAQKKLKYATFGKDFRAALGLPENLESL